MVANTLKVSFKLLKSKHSTIKLVTTVTTHCPQVESFKSKLKPFKSYSDVLH